MNASEICIQVAQNRGINPRDLVKRDVTPRRYCQARQEAMARIRRDLGWSYHRIGKYFGGLHHTTVIYACKLWIGKISQAPGHNNESITYARRRPTNNELRAEVDELRIRVLQMERIIAKAGLLAK